MRIKYHKDFYISNTYCLSIIIIIFYIIFVRVNLIRVFNEKIQRYSLCTFTSYILSRTALSDFLLSAAYTPFSFLTAPQSLSPGLQDTSISPSFHPKPLPIPPFRPSTYSALQSHERKPRSPYPSRQSFPPIQPYPLL